MCLLRVLGKTIKVERSGTHILGGTTAKSPTTSSSGGCMLGHEILPENLCLTIRNRCWYVLRSCWTVLSSTNLNWLSTWTEKVLITFWYSNKITRSKLDEDIRSRSIKLVFIRKCSKKMMEENNDGYLIKRILESKQSLLWAKFPWIPHS